jgi:hypothetical protein
MELNQLLMPQTRLRLTRLPGLLPMRRLTRPLRATTPRRPLSTLPRSPALRQDPAALEVGAEDELDLQQSGL